MELIDVVTPLDKAIKLLNGQAALARALGLTPMAVTNWKKRGNVPIKHAIKIEQLTNSQVTHRELCPELFEDVA